MGFGSEVEKHHSRGQHDPDRHTTLCLVRRIINAISKVGFVTIEDLNPSRSTGSSNAAVGNPIQDLGLGVQQIQAQVQNLCLEIQKLKQEQSTCSEVWEEVWCIKCRSQGHDKDHCLGSMNFVVTGGPTPLRPEA